MPSDYTPENFQPGGTFEAHHARAMSEQIDEEEEINEAQETAIAGKQAADPDLGGFAAIPAGDGYAKRVSGLWAPVSAIPKADLHTAVQASLDKADTAVQPADLFPVEKLSTGFCFPHRMLNGSSVVVLSGRIQLEFFQAPETADRNNIVKYAGATAWSGNAPTMIKFGVYSVHPTSGDLTRIAVTANDPAEFAVAFDVASEPFLAPCPFVYGNWYASATLIITTGTINTMWGVGSIGAGELFTAPRRCAQVTGQTDLPENIPAASVGNVASVITFTKFI